MTRAAAKTNEKFIIVPKISTDNNVEVSIAPEIMNSRVILLPCFITTDMISPLRACKRRKTFFINSTISLDECNTI